MMKGDKNYVQEHSLVEGYWALWEPHKPKPETDFGEVATGGGVLGRGILRTF